MASFRHKGRRCIVAGCSNTAGNGVSVHTFPKETKTRNAWKRFVKLTRADWEEPTKHSAICSEHFTTSCFAVQFNIKESLGFASKRRLNTGSVPSIYPKRGRERQDDAPVPEKKPRGAYEKRKIARVMSDFLAAGQQNTPTCTSTPHVPLTDNDKENVEPAFFPNDSISDISDDKPKVQLVDKKTQVKIKIRTKEKGIGVDISPCIRSIGIQCDLLPSEPRGKVTDPEPPIPAPESPVISVVDSEDTLSYLSDEDASLYQPSLSDNSSDSDIDSHEDFPSGPSGERKFIVCESNLMELFQVCRFCGNEAHGEIKHVMGTLVKIETVCASCTFPTYWYSQPFVGAIPSVNLAMSASILFSGAIPTKALRMFQFMNISHVSKETFMLHQKNYLFPAISFCWNSHQSRYVQNALARGTPLVLGGDGRADTPGHSAKYGSYGLMDLQDGVVIDIQLVQSNEVKSSNNMEKEGLVRAMSVLKERGLSVGALVTDRHLQIQKWVRENMPTTDHYYDVWHVAKGLKKKLCSLAKEKDCGEVTDWIKSLTNHLYWCAASTPPGEGNIMWAKWVSLENHIQNIHHGHGNLFPDCAHPDMDPEVRRRKKWLKPGTKACEKVGDLITSRQMKRDIPKLSPEFQTSEIEAYHSTINHFAPKMIGFSYHGMYCRLLLAAMHFNENSGREQSLTKEGIPKYNIVYPKYKKGEHTIRQMKIDQSFHYVENLMSVTTQITKKVRMHNNNSIRLPTSVPAPLCSDYLHPDKEEAISSFSSRFARKETSA